jgi:predicted alpha/beta superfamily hydrolase
MRLSLHLAALISFAATTALAQSPLSNASAAAPLVMGETFTITSGTLHEVRRINVYAPAVYADSPGVRLPVLYMPDGGMREDFLHVAGLVEVLTGNGTMRPFILVGIENTQRRRDLTGPTQNERDRRIAPVVGGSEAFRAFIRTELMPVIRQRYRTTGETAIVGESLAGLFVVETFLREPDLFDTYVAFDPSLWWNDGRMVAGAAGQLRGRNVGHKTLWFASSSDVDKDNLPGQLADVLRQGNYPGLDWHYEPMPEEGHPTIFHPGALRAFRAVFKPAPADSTHR